MRLFMVPICLVLVLALTPAQSLSWFHRPIFHHRLVVQPQPHPVTLTGPATILSAGSGGSGSAQSPSITVDSAVQASILATKKNLDSASSTINDLLRKNGIDTAPPATDAVPIRKGIDVPAKTGRFGG